MFSPQFILCILHPLDYILQYCIFFEQAPFPVLHTSFSITLSSCLTQNTVHTLHTSSCILYFSDQRSIRRAVLSTYRNSFFTLTLRTSHVSTMQYPQVSPLFPPHFLCSSFCTLYNVCHMLCSLPSPTLAILPSGLCSHSPCLSLLSVSSVCCALFAVLSFPFPVLITVTILILQCYLRAPVTPSAPLSPHSVMHASLYIAVDGTVR